MTQLDELTDLGVEEPTGYASEDTYFATRIRQGGRDVFSIDLSVPQLVQSVQRPDAARILEGNRRIKVSQAKSFAEYPRKRPNWVCPPLLLRAPEGEFSFRTVKEVGGGSEFGVLSMPRLSRTSLSILDGQHRVLGFHMLWDQLETDIRRARDQVAEARRSGDPDNLAHWERRRDELLAYRNRLGEERIRVDIVVIDDPKDVKQVFVDIADNARGISGAVKARFDSTKVVNRALDEVLRHPLLVGRVDEQTDRITRESRYLVGAKHVADIIRAVQVGATGRISKRQEAELQEATVAREALGYFDLLVDSLPVLGDLMEDVLTPPELRRSSLLGSSTILRVLAGVYHELAEVGTPKKSDLPSMSKEEVGAFFALLGPEMEKVPVTEDGPWLATACFGEGTYAPGARHQEVTKLEEVIAGWARAGMPTSA